MHVMPNELEQCRQSLWSLWKAAEEFEDDYCNDELELYITLNLSGKVINWKESSIPQEQVIINFNNILSYNPVQISIKSDIILSNIDMGTTAQKRNAIRQADKSIKNFIFLDPDIYFHWSTLKYIIDASKYIENEYYIITPQTVKLWDETWDVITNKKFIGEPYNFYKTFDSAKVVNQNITDVDLVEISTFKFGCGWFTLYSANLWKFVDIPDELGEYGSEDTFLMFACMIMKERGYDVQQYMLDGLYISEDYKYRPQSYEGKIVRYTTKEQNYVKHNTPKFAELINDFSKNLKINTEQ